MTKLEHHIFVCENQRPAGSLRGCCVDKGSEKLRAAFKAEILKRNLKGRVRANKAGCLDHCETGATVVVYPEQIWYAGVQEKDVPEIMDSIKEGRIVERLCIPEED